MSDEFNRGKREGIQVMADMVAVMIPDFEKRIEAAEEFLLGQFPGAKAMAVSKPKGKTLKVSDFVMYHKSPPPNSVPGGSLCLGIVSNTDFFKDEAVVMLIDHRTEAGLPPQFVKVPLDPVVGQFKGQADKNGPATYGLVQKVAK